MQNLANFWHCFFCWFISRIYFTRVMVLSQNRLPQSGPVLFLGLHRNGAVDGFVYHVALGGPVFMISTQLRKSWFSRIFFAGIEVTRAKDEGERAGNAEALVQCVEHLRAGAAVCVFPEGTSSLGPRHLPFKSGAARLILEYLERGGPPIQVVPVGIHYECPWAFRSRIEVVIGQSINVNVPKGGSHIATLKELKRRIEAGLETVGVSVVSSDYQDQIQKLAYVSTLATRRSYFGSLKALEEEIPNPILQNWSALERELAGRSLLFHQGVPLVPMGSAFVYLIALVLLAPVVFAAIVLNLLPFLAGWIAGKTLPDDLNVVSLWKILVGVPVFLLWIAFVTAFCLYSGKPIWLLGYTALTWTGLVLYYRVKKLAVAAYNGLRHPKIKLAMLQFRQTVLQNLPPDPYAS